MKRPYIEPPRSEDCIWRDGPPPGIGWWPASLVSYLDPTVLRWWDGKWSSVALDSDSAERAGRVASLESITHERFIRWTDRWWETNK